MNCPSCNAEISFDQRFASVLICEYCHTSMTFDAGVFEIQGEMSLLASPLGIVAVGSYGTLKGKGFQVLGRVRYGYELGAWDEWYLLFDDETTAWFTEDEKRFTLEKPVTIDCDAELLKAIQPGEIVSLADKEFMVRERGTVICEGGEGQLPFSLVLNDVYYFVDLQSPDGGTATIEIEPDGTVKFFDGEPVDIGTLVVNNPINSNLDSYEHSGDKSRRQRLSMTADKIVTVQCLGCGATEQVVDWSSDEIKCSHCALPMTMPAKTGICNGCGNHVQAMSDDAASVGCQYCGKVVTLSSNSKKTKIQAIATAKKKAKPRSVFPLGMWATFDDIKFQLVGLITYVEIDDGTYYTYEYLFYAKEYGYRWLSCYNGHFSLEEKVQGGLKTPLSTYIRSGHRSIIREFGKNWKVYEYGTQKISSVYGEMPWVAKKGDKSNYIELIAPPYSLTHERSKDEVEFSVSKYISHAALQKAVGNVKVDWPIKRGIAANQVNSKKFDQLVLGVVGILFALLGSFLFYDNLHSGDQVSFINVTANQYKEEFLTKPFRFSGSKFSEVQVYAPVSNSWVWLDYAIVNDKEEVILDASANLSYYHGYEGGESWSEGSRNDSTLFKDIPAGNYQLLLRGQAGKGESSQITTSSGEPVNIRVLENVRIARYYLIFSVAALFFALLGFGSLLSFEARRWKHLRE